MCSVSKMNELVDLALLKKKVKSEREIIEI